MHSSKEFLQTTLKFLNFSRNHTEDVNKFFHLDYGDIYHKHDPDLKLDFIKKLESTQYSAALALSGAWHETSRQKLYDELG